MEMEASRYVTLRHVSSAHSVTPCINLVLRIAPDMSHMQCTGPITANLSSQNQTIDATYIEHQTYVRTVD